MPQSEMRLIKSVLEYIPKDRWGELEWGMRGFYVLYNYRRRSAQDDNFDFVYVGLSQNNIKGRIKKHANSLTKWDKWTHFSVFEVWDNISAEEIAELEGLFRHLFRWDSKANTLGIQKSYKPLTILRKRTEQEEEQEQFRWKKKANGWRGPNR
jgi:hypothetical protein